MHEKHTMDRSEVVNGKGRSAGVRTGTSRPTTMRVGRVLVVRCASTTRGSRETRSKGTISKLQNAFLTTARLTATTTATTAKLKGKGESDMIKNVLRRRKWTMMNMRNA